jgi:hypothetical protein
MKRTAAGALELSWFLRWVIVGLFDTMMRGVPSGVITAPPGGGGGGGGGGGDGGVVGGWPGSAAPSPPPPPPPHPANTAHMSAAQSSAAFDLIPLVRMTVRPFPGVANGAPARP